jgi:dipeptidase
MKLRVLLVVTVMLGLAAVMGFAQWLDGPEDENCTMIVVGKDASVDGSVMTTHTCDGWYDSRIFIIPGGTHEADEMVPIYKNMLHADRTEPTIMGYIPQVAETYSAFLVAYPFMNEHQIMMGEHTFSGRREYRNPEGGLFYIEQLQLIGLQRGKTAREVIQIMGDLADEYGYADGGECISVCDPNEAWVFEIVGAGPLWRQGDETPGAVWVAKRVPDNAVYAGANRSLIGQIDLSDPDNYMAGAGIYSVGEKLGFWNPTAGKTFYFWDVYGAKADSYYNSRREWRVRDLVAPSLELDPYARRFPFSVVPDQKVSVADLMAIQRDYYEGTPFDLTQGLSAGPFGTPDRYATSSGLNVPGSVGWERAIAMFRCSYTIVSQSRAWLPDPIGGVMWFGPDAPHGTVYMPIYCGVTSLPESLQIMDRYDFTRDSAWWAFDFVQNWANLAWSYMVVDIREHQSKYEGLSFAMQPAIESAALQLYNTDPALAVTFLTNYTADVVNRTVAATWEFADFLVTKYNDGYVNNSTKSYPKEWLDQTDFGSTTMVEDFKDIWYGEYEPQ